MQKILVLKFGFKCLTLLGMWIPDELSYKKKLLLKFVQYFLNFICLFMLLSMNYYLIKKIHTKNDVHEYFEGLVVLPLELIAYSKYTFTCVKRKQILQLADYFRKDEFRPLNKFEQHQDQKYEFIMK